MNKKQQQSNPAKDYLSKYQNAKMDRLGYMLNYDMAEVHAANIAECEATMREVDAVIQKIENAAQREIIRLRYECGWNWRRIINRMAMRGYGESMCYIMHGRALQHVKRLLSQK